MDRSLFYQKHLDRVSRSFAFCIARLASPYREWIGLSYLLCRIVDTVEDSQWKNQKDQDQAFSQFLQFISEPDALEALPGWVSSLPKDIPESELLLLQDAEVLLTDLHELEDPVKAAILPSLKHMTEGMRHFCQRDENSSRSRMKTLEQANQYCFFVAGVVGELLTKVFHHGLPQFELSQTHLSNGIHFGLFLQKINLLKDQQKDEVEGRFLIPSREAVQESLKVDLYRAFEYLKALPSSHFGFRLFCGWSLFLGVASLPWIERSWKEKKAIKIPRLQTWSLLEKVESRIDDNQRLENLLLEVWPDALSAPTSLPSAPLNEWFTRIYEGGALTEASLAKLNLFPPPAS